MVAGSGGDPTGTKSCGEQGGGRPGTLWEKAGARGCGVSAHGGTGRQSGAGGAPSEAGSPSGWGALAWGRPGFGRTSPGASSSGGGLLAPERRPGRRGAGPGPGAGGARAGPAAAHLGSGSRIFLLARAAGVALLFSMAIR